MVDTLYADVNRQATPDSRKQHAIHCVPTLQPYCIMVITQFWLEIRRNGMQRCMTRGIQGNARLARLPETCQSRN